MDAGASLLQPTAPSMAESQLGGVGCQENHSPQQSTRPTHTPWMLSLPGVLFPTASPAAAPRAAFSW